MLNVLIKQFIYNTRHIIYMHIIKCSQISSTRNPAGIFNEAFFVPRR